LSWFFEHIDLKPEFIVPPFENIAGDRASQARHRFFYLRSASLRAGLRRKEESVP